jgi:hypothetical protein
LPKKKEEILGGFEYYKNGGLLWTDQEAMDKQKGVLGEVLK